MCGVSSPQGGASQVNAVGEKGRGKVVGEVVREAEWSGVAVIKALGALALKRKCFKLLTSGAESR